MKNSSHCKRFMMRIFIYASKNAVWALCVRRSFHLFVSLRIRSPQPLNRCEPNMEAGLSVRRTAVLILPRILSVPGYKYHIFIASFSRVQFLSSFVYFYAYEFTYWCKCCALPSLFKTFSEKTHDTYQLPGARCHLLSCFDSKLVGVCPNML